MNSRDVESELQAAATEFLTLLRQGRGMDTNAAGRLKNALREAAKQWERSDVVPKSAANLFVDLSSGIEACSYSYGPDEANRIRLVADEIADLVRRCGAPRQEDPQCRGR
jgi:hypothetical protein